MQIKTPLVAPSSEWLVADGDIVVGDVIRYVETVFAGWNTHHTSLGVRTVTARILRDSYGLAKQQHTITLLVLASESDNPALKLETHSQIERKARNIYRNGVMRQPWDDEPKRLNALKDKHARGEAARKSRDVRRRAEKRAKRHMEFSGAELA